jgi:D-alanine--poly(phosphoribitol) ligase subunit 2
MNMKNVVQWTDELMRVLPDALLVEIESPDLDLFESGTLDSLGLVELLAVIDRRYHVRLALDELDLDQIRTVRSIATLLSNGSQPSTANSVEA